MGNRFGDPSGECNENKMNTISELTKRLEALLAEKRDIKAFLAQVFEKEKRLASLCNGWGCIGEIEVAKRLLRDAAFPIFIGSGNGHSRNQRVVSVDDKWIGIRSDGAEEKKIDFYRRSTGQKKGTRANWRKIDAEKALEVWSNHKV